ncbi:hypothetical protein CXF72_06865 [Psychromonas sp. MB-3u-54]|uniref:class I SAM-dependent methyltransferase n=1 Tax=Psychromonas sp. MB-3u-54 TaxID=2058319 RepID=UPI000C33ABB6|nr:class I SAM-dependent methyltransferase [Psychromonas sp. MB-3u-54]PKH03347.1 hypothetical protein CXF72_06865 [Psychromonas sp. MB-3u-54]
MKNSKQFIQRLLSSADIRLNGSKDDDIQVHNSRFYDDLLAGGSLALEEAYVRGDWDCKSVYHVVSIVMFEHVGPRNYREHIKKQRDCLKDNGLFLLHTIGSNAVSRNR